MKLTHSLLLAASSILAVSSANAQTVIDITGSTAGRTAVHQAILSVLSNETFVYNGTNFNGASKALFKGDISGTPVIVRTSWSGSAAGVRDVAQSNSSVWFPATTIDTTGAANNTAVSMANSSSNTVQDTPEIAFSDVFQSSTIYTSPALTDVTAGVIPFKFFASKDAPATVTNITSLVARNLFGTGYIPTALLSGNSSDEASYFFATGRDPESGTRITAMAEIGYGVFGQVQNQQPTVVSGNVTGVAQWPAGTYAAGNGGASSGSSVKGYLEAAGYAGGYGLISYLGSSDWSSVAKELTFNGVTYSADNVKNGKYTFWGYLHQMRLSGLSGTALSFFNSLTTAVRADTTWLVKTSDMRVERTSDGGLINPLY